MQNSQPGNGYGTQPNHLPYVVNNSMQNVQAIPQLMDGDASLRVNGATKRKRQPGGHSTYLKATIGVKDYDCLLDTGSEVSLLPAVLVDKSYITRTSQTLKAANGTTIPILGEVAMPIRVGQFETTVNGLVS